MSEITEHSSGHITNGGAPPRIDPTKLTTDMVNIAKEDIRREAESFREVTFMKIDDLRTEVMSEIRRVNDINDQKFDSVNTQFELVERGRVEQKIDTKQAVDAALIAQKEAVKEQTIASEKSIEKSEAATTKQIDAQAIAFGQGLSAQTTQLNDLKVRVVTIEASGAGQEKGSNKTQMGLYYIAVLLLGFISLLPHIHWH